MNLINVKNKMNNQHACFLKTNTGQNLMRDLKKKMRVC